MTQMRKIPVVIDCDPGVDDTLAILLANARPDIEVRAICPVAGNVEYTYTSENARRLAAYLDMPCRVARGADRPLLIPARTAGAIHGQGGLGGYELPDTDREYDEKYAWDVLYEEAVRAEGELELIGLGPLTNVAIALKCHPDLKGLLRGITLMAGTAGKGNTNPYAEFNVWVDPHACEIVLQSGIPIRMCGLDGNSTCMLDTGEMYGIFGTPSRVTEVTDHIAHFIHERNTVQWNLPGSTIHDLVTMACFLEPSIARYEDVHMSCELIREDAMGQTKVSAPDSEHPANVQFLRSADKDAYIRMLREMMAFYKEYKD